MVAVLLPVFSLGQTGQDVDRERLQTAFRAEKTKVAGGSELITIFSRKEIFDGPMQGPDDEIPLVSVLRDTLGDDIPENDRLRYLWMLTHTDPTFKQKLSAFIPFLYRRTVNKDKVGNEPPPPILDMNSPRQSHWDKVFWAVFKRLVFEDVGVALKASTLQYRQNQQNYRHTGIAAAAALISLYQEIEGEKLLSDQEMKDIQARLFLTEKPLGSFMQSENLERIYNKETSITRDYRGHNWELLRQYAERQGLYFDPLVMPDGSMRQAMLWVAASDLKANKGKAFDRRFLNIKNPWTDKSLANWKGYSEVRWYDSEDREVDPETPNAHPRTLIPLALYGLDHPKVPIILIDFRNNDNPRRREMSRRVLNDLTGNVLSLSKFGGLPFFLGRFVYDFVTGRRGADLNQASRLRSYSQLKLFIALEDSLDPGLKREMTERIESATLNPLQNDADIEARIAKAQYKNLMAYASDPTGLPKKIDDDRREEMSRFTHSGKVRALHSLGRFLTFGLYTHRETSTPERMAELDRRRQLDHHERFLREVAARSSDPVIDGQPEEVRRSLEFVAANGEPVGSKTVKALSKLFSVSSDTSIQKLCLRALYRINSESAKKELLAIYERTDNAEEWRTASAEYLRLALQEGQRMSVRDAKTVAAIGMN